MTETAIRGERVGRTILLSPHLNEIAAVLREHGFNAMTWPDVNIQPPHTFATLDEAIENLFGYDWLIFVNEDAAHFFLERFAKQGHDVSELDSLRVCAIGEKTAAELEHSRVHVDVIVPNGAGSSIVEQIGNYVGGHESLRRLNFLIPQASIGRAYLKQELEQVEARADVVISYQTVAAGDATRLSVLQSLLLADSVDAVVFSTDSDVTDFGRLFAANDLGRLLINVRVFLLARTAPLVIQRGLVVPLISEVSSPDELVAALIKRFSI